MTTKDVELFLAAMELQRATSPQMIPATHKGRLVIVSTAFDTQNSQVSAFLKLLAEENELPFGHLETPSQPIGLWPVHCRETSDAEDLCNGLNEHSRPAKQPKKHDWYKQFNRNKYGR